MVPTTVASTASPSAATSVCGAQSGGEPGSQMLLNDVKIVSRGDHDQIVFTFEPGAKSAAVVPEWKVSAASPPFTQDASGEPVEVEGTSHLSITFMASGVDLSGAEFRETYKGEDRIKPAEPQAIAELVKAGDFENHLSWFVGLSTQSCFSVSTTQNPVQVAVDIGPNVTQLTAPTASPQ